MRADANIDERIAEGQIADGQIADGYVELAAEVFTLLSDPTRIRIILALADASELAVGELAGRVGKAPAAVSQHLAKLRWAKVVHARQDGNRVHYRLRDEHASELVHQALMQVEHVVESQPRHHAESVPLVVVDARRGAAR